jgi:flagellin
MRKLSTGVKINSAKDDAAGLAIANKLSMQTIGLNRASQNAMDGVSLIQTTDGALSVVMNMMQRMRELAVQAANGVLTPEDQSKIQTEADQLAQEISDNANKTEFNKIKVLSGESDTVARSMMGVGAGRISADRIASILALSENLSAGELFYTISRPALPAETTLNLSNLYLTDTAFAINSVSVDVRASDSMDDIRRKLAQACDLASVDLIYDASGIAYLATQGAGKEQRLVISSGNNPAINTNASGTDVVIDPGSVYLKNPDGTLNVEFNNAKSVTAKGNEITIATSNGRYVRLGVKVFFSLRPSPNGFPDPDDFVYGDGKSTDVPPYSAGTSVISAPIDLSVELRGYGPLYLQIGPSYNQHMPVRIPRVTAETLGFLEYKGGGSRFILDYQSPEGAARALGTIDQALGEVSSIRATLGAYQNRLEQTVTNVDTAALNTETARSRIQDTDIAKSMAEYTQMNVKYQAGVAILAQANQRPQQLLSLLQ